MDGTSMLKSKVKFAKLIILAFRFGLAAQRFAACPDGSSFAHRVEGFS
jgi:hypothetical protein